MSEPAVPESIRATAIDRDELAAIILKFFVPSPTGGSWRLNPTKAADAIIESWLPAVVAQVQADTIEKFADTLGVDVGDEYDDYALGYRNGQRQALRKATAMAAEYREKGDNHNE